MDKENIKRCENYIDFGNGITAEEGYDGLHTLTFFKGGKEVYFYRGSSLYFSSPELTEDDKEYLASLAEVIE